MQYNNGKTGQDLKQKAFFPFDMIALHIQTHQRGNMNVMCVCVCALISALLTSHISRWSVDGKPDNRTKRFKSVTEKNNTAPSVILS